MLGDQNNADSLSWLSKQCRFSFVGFFLVHSRTPILGTQRYCTPSPSKKKFRKSRKLHLENSLGQTYGFSMQIDHFWTIRGGTPLQGFSYCFSFGFALFCFGVQNNADSPSWLSKQCRFSFVGFFLVHSGTPILGTQRSCDFRLSVFGPQGGR